MSRQYRRRRSDVRQGELLNCQKSQYRPHHQPYAYGRIFLSGFQRQKSGCEQGDVLHQNPQEAKYFCGGERFGLQFRHDLPKRKGNFSAGSNRRGGRRTQLYGDYPGQRGS